MRDPIENITLLQRQINELQIENQLLKNLLSQNGVSYEKSLLQLKTDEHVEEYELNQGKRIIHPDKITNESKRPSFCSDRYQFTVVMPNLNYDVPQDFEGNETMSESMSKSMSESMSELERTRMQIILHYLDTNKEINSSIAAKLLEVEIKTASRLLLKAEKLDILKSYGKTKNKVYFRE